MQHARLSPSAADRFMVCTASVPLIERLLAAGAIKESDLEGEVAESCSEDDLLAQNFDAYEDVVLDPTRESTTFSAEGTVMHEVRADALFFEEDPHHYVGEVRSADGFSFEITADMADKLVGGIDWIRETADAPVIESRVPLDEWLPGNYGFCDTYWLSDGVLYVSDLKFGIGEPVAAIDNRQLQLYALGAWLKMGKPSFTKVILNIDQPRAGGMKFWERTFDELMAFGDEVRRVYGRIQRGDVEFVPTKKGCRFCPVKKTERGCAAYNQWALWMLGNSVLDVSNGEPRFTDPAQMSRAMRYYIVSHAAAIRAWLAKLHDESLNAAISGDPDPGSKAIEGPMGRRFFTDEAAAEYVLVSALGTSAYKKKLIGFTEIDKIMKPGKRKQGFPDHYAELLRLVDQSDGQPKLVPADHPAPAFTQTAEDDFDDQEDYTDDFDEN